MSGKLRVIQWATGNVGNEALRAILAHPQLELAGVRVYGEEKRGVDAGALCGQPETGVRATDDAEALLALDADCVVYMPRHAHLDEVCALLRSGKNVVCTPFLFFPEALPAADCARLREACAAGRSSVHGTGIHPGFVGVVLPLVLSGMSREIRRIHVVERADWTFYASPRITFDNMRFGHPPEAATLEANAFARFNAGIFAEQAHALAAALGATLSDVSVDQELEVADAPRDVRAGRVEAGTVGAQRYRWRGWRDGEALIEIDALWTLGGDAPSHWPRARHGWTVRLEGDPSLRAHFTTAASFERRDVSVDDHIHSADVATAMLAVNAIPALCAAPPGICPAFALPLIHAGIGFRAPGAPAAR